MKKLYKKIILFIFVIGFMLLLKSEVNAANISISAPSTATVGKSCTVTITGSGAASYDVVANISGAGVKETIYLNAYTDDLQNGRKSASKTITPTSAGTITISIASSSNVTVSGASGSQSISGSSKKIVVSEETKKEETKPQTPTTPSNSGTTKKPTTTTTTQKPTTTTKTETKTEEKKEDNFYISNVTLKGIKENDEQVDITLSPAFNKDTYEYTCNITSDIQKIDLQKDAGEYTNSVIVTGLDELKEGENIVTLQLSAENHEAKTYTIKIIKEEKEEAKEVVAEVLEQEKNIDNNKEETDVKMISMPVWAFILMQVIIIVIEVIVISFVPWKKLFTRKNKDVE